MYFDSYSSGGRIVYVYDFTAVNRTNIVCEESRTETVGVEETRGCTTGYVLQ